MNEEVDPLESQKEMNRTKSPAYGTNARRLVCFLLVLAFTSLIISICSCGNLQFGLIHSCLLVEIWYIQIPVCAGSVFFFCSPRRHHVLISHVNDCTNLARSGEITRSVPLTPQKPVVQRMNGGTVHSRHKYHTVKNDRIWI